jgi:hypothetical protein
MVACVIALALSAPADAVTLLFGLEPGKSTRADADRVFGAPRRAGAFEVEYAPHKGSGPIIATLTTDGQTIDRLELHLVSPLARDVMLRALKLSDPPMLARSTAGKFVEYFGSPHSLILTHVDHTPSSAIASVGYASAAHFTRIAEGVATEQFDPERCRDVYFASVDETKTVRGGNAVRRQAIMAVMIAAQKGDCLAARRLMAEYAERYRLRDRRP